MWQKRDEEASSGEEVIMATLADLIDKEELLRRLQLNADFAKGSSGDVDTMYGGGRVGYAFPVGQDSDLTLGARFGGYRADVKPMNKVFDDFDLQGVDAEYRKGNHAIGAEYSPDQMLNLYYRLNF